MNPDYKQIYSDILHEKFPEKLSDAIIKSQLERLYTAVDILKCNQLIFGDPNYPVALYNQRLRSYDEKSIVEILRYQKKNNLNNTEVSVQFKISRNTIAKWKSVFKV